MSYVTIAEIEKRIGAERLLVLSNLGVAVDSSGVPLARNDEHIAAKSADAEAEINSYVGAKYDVPVSDGRAERALAACALVLIEEGLRLDAHQPLDEEFQRLVAVKRKWLADVSRGLAVLWTDEPQTSPDARAGVTRRDRLFPDDLPGY